MAMKLKKLFKTLIPKSTPKAEDAAIEELDDNVVDAEEVRVTELNSMEEMFNERTKDLEGAKDQLKEISATSYPVEPGKSDALVKDTLAQLLKEQGPNPFGGAVASKNTEPPAGKKTSVAPGPELDLNLQSLKLTEEGKEELALQEAAAALSPVQAKPTPEVKVPPLAAKILVEDDAQKKAEASEMISRIFNKEEETDDPLAGLTASLPKATIREILDEAQELKAMLLEWNQN